MTDEEKASITTYTGEAYKDINSYLRGLSSTTEHADDIKNIMSALDKASLPEETIVRRGMVNADGLFKGVDMKDLGLHPEKYVGMVVNDKGFVSTSPVENHAFITNVRVYIKLPKGSKAMYIAPMSQIKKEKELLINANSKFVVESLHASYSEKYNETSVSTIYLRLVE